MSLLPTYLSKPHLGAKLAELIASEIYQYNKDDTVALSERSIAERFDVSRQVVRDALSILSAEGIIAVRQGKGIIMVDPKKAKLVPDAVEFYYQLRAQIESRNVRLVVQDVSSECIERLEACLKTQKELGQKLQRVDPPPSPAEFYREFRSTADDFVDSDLEFHTRIAEAAGDIFLQTILEMILARLLPFRFVSITAPERIQETIDEHERVLDGIKAGDPDEAVKAIETHITNVCALRVPH
ncbi:MAG: FadR/GntR family transcriptional regulator [Anaerolineae bacterium]